MSWDESQGSSGSGWQQPYSGQGGEAPFGQGAQPGQGGPTQPFGQGGGAAPADPTQPFGPPPQQPVPPYPYGMPGQGGAVPPQTQQFGDYQQYPQQQYSQDQYSQGQSYQQFPQNQQFQQYQQYPPQYPMAPAPKKSKGPIIAAVVGVVVVGAAVGGYFALSGSSNGNQTNASSTSSASALSSAPSTGGTGGTGGSGSGGAGGSGGTGGSSSIALPGSAAGQLLLSTDSAKEEAQRVKDGVVSGGASVYVNPLVGAYGPKADGGYRLVMVVEPFSHMSADYQSQLKSADPKDTVEQFADAAHMSDATQEPSTDSNAAIVCGTLDASGDKILTCVWIDSESLGITYYYDAYYTTSESDAAKDTDELRAAAEAG